MNRLGIESVKDVLTTSGRFFHHRKDNVLYMNWSGSAFELTFTGTCLAAEFIAMAGVEYEGIPGDTTAPFHMNYPWIAVYVDGKLSFKTEVGDEQSILLFSSEQEKTVRIRVVKLTENMKTQLGLCSFLTDGTIAKAQRTTEGRIEFIGDSITCGFGNLSRESSRFFYTSDEDAEHSHAVLAANALAMDYSLVSISGICSTTNTGLPNPYAMDELYEYTDKVMFDLLKEEGEPERFDFKNNHNDFVVLNLGTNDGTGILFCEDRKSEFERFRKGYRAFLENIRRLNGPDTYIVCALGTMNYFMYTDICEIVENYKKETGDENVSCFRYYPIHPFDGFGSAFHPTLATQTKMAKEIEEEIRRIKTEKGI